MQWEEEVVCVCFFSLFQQKRSTGTIVLYGTAWHVCIGLDWIGLGRVASELHGNMGFSIKHFKRALLGIVSI